MKIVSIELSNFKRFETFETAPDGRSIIILGPNEGGKSSLLDSILFALNPEKETPATKIPEPLREGAKAGFVKIVAVGADGKKYTVTRKVNDSDERKISITGPDGLTTNKIEMLNKLIGYKKVDPFEFVAWGSTAEGRRKQLTLIESLLSPAIKKSLEDIKQSLAEAEDRLKMANSSKTTHQNNLDTIEVSPTDIIEYAEPINIRDEMDALKTAQEENREVDLRKEKYEKAKDLVSFKKAEIAKIKLELEKAEAQLEELVATEQSLVHEVLNDEKTDTGPIEERIASAQIHNSKNDKVVRYNEVSKKLEAAAQTAAEKKKEVDELVTKRKAVIAAAKLPVPGLTFDEDQVYLNGFPLHEKQVSTSQIIKLSFAIALAMGAGNDKLKLLCIPRGESLDGNSFGQLKDFLAENPDWQAFVEMVDRNKEEIKVEFIENV